MNRKVVSGMMFILLFIGMLTWTLNIQPVRASGTIYIRPDGTIDPPTALIQRDGDVYTFTNNVYDKIVVQRDNIVVDGAGFTLEGTGVVDSRGIDQSGRSNVTIKNMEIKGFWCGIWLCESSNQNTIAGNNITDNDLGIRLRDSSNNTISDNLITNNGYGIGLQDSSNNTISGNLITNNWQGIELSWSSNNTLRNNDASNNKYNFGIYGLLLSHYIQDIDNSNTVDGKPIWYLVNQEDLVINPKTFPNVGYVGIVNSVNITVQHISIDNNMQGILLAGTMNSKVENMTLTNNGEGIGLYWSRDNTIIGNKITNNGHGIPLRDSSNNTISGNLITNNNWDGICLISSSNNTFYHNQFINNTQQVYISGSGYPNYWDDGYPSGGNYWSDYEERYPGATEMDDSGIWDTPYAIDENNQDNYPLMKPWSPKPPSPKEAIEELVQTVESLHLGAGIETSLTSKLQAAHRSLNRENQNAAIGQLTAFLNEVEALRNKKLTDKQANQLATEAQRIIDLIKGE